MAVPGWPELALRGASMARPRMTLMPNCSMFSVGTTCPEVPPAAAVWLMGANLHLSGARPPREAAFPRPPLSVSALAQRGEER